MRWLNPAVFVVGLASIGVGAWWLSPPWSLIVIGAALVGIVLIGLRNEPTRKTR